MRILSQRHNRTADNIWRAEIASHGIQRDFHRSAILRTSGPECKIKKFQCGRGLRAANILQGLSEPGFEPPAILLRCDRQDLPAFVITAGWAGRMRGDGASTLRAFIKLRR